MLADQRSRRRAGRSWPHMSRMRALPEIAVAVALSIIASGAIAETTYSRKLVELVNQYRASKGMPILVTDSTIASLAQEHSSAMAKAKRMDHDDLPSRVKRSGLAMCVENVGWNYPSPEAMFAAWQASPGHNHNMLDPRVERIGIGDSLGYVTMIACAH